MLIEYSNKANWFKTYGYECKELKIQMKYYIHEIDKLFYDIAKGKQLSLNELSDKYYGIWVEMTDEEYRDFRKNIT